MENCLLDVGGLSIGHAHDAEVKTGVSVILPDAPMACAVDVRGGGPGTRETDTLGASGLINAVHAVVLSGGSVYGLGAADGVCALLGSQRRGYAPSESPHVPVSPIVPSAILFDNANGGNKDWGVTPPYRDLGIQAVKAASQKPVRGGAVGAGYGATAGLYPGGLGSASETVDGVTIGAMIAANPVGSPYMPGSDCFWAWPYDRAITGTNFGETGFEYGGVKPAPDYAWVDPQDTKLAFLKAAGQSTVIGVVGVSIPLSPKQLNRLAIMAQDGIAMAVRPAHTPLDGDTIFALSPQDMDAQSPSKTSPVDLALLGAAAARCVARALSKGIYHARATS